MTTTNVQSLDNLDLNNLVPPQQRDIYVGPRILRAVEARWQGHLHELQVGMMVATLAGGDEMGHPFWIAKITDIIKDEPRNQVTSIVVHWFHTSYQMHLLGNTLLRWLRMSKAQAESVEERIYRARLLSRLTI